MGKGVKVLIIIVVIAVLGVVGYLVFGDSAGSDNETKTSSSQSTEETANPVAESPAGTEAAATVTYTDDGFSPSLSTIKAGQAIKFVNNASQALQLDSDPHPQHTDLPALNVGTIEKGKTKTVTISEKGNWGFHNHLNSSDEATVNVK